MLVEVRVPSPGESITEVQVAEWLVEDGEYVEKDQDIVEIDSDKATLPLASPADGTIYIISISVPNRDRDMPTRDFVDIRFGGEMLYQMFSIDDNRLDYQVFNIDGEIKDHLTIEK